MKKKVFLHATFAIVMIASLFIGYLPSGNDVFESVIDVVKAEGVGNNSNVTFASDRSCRKSTFDRLTVKQSQYRLQYHCLTVNQKNIRYSFEIF